MLRDMSVLSTCQRPYPCGTPGCDKRYTDPSSLRKHQRCHASLSNLCDVSCAPSSTFYFMLHHNNIGYKRLSLQKTEARCDRSKDVE